MYYVVGTSHREWFYHAYPSHRLALLAAEAATRQGHGVVSFFLEREPTKEEIQHALRGIPPAGARDGASQRPLTNES